MVCWDPNLFTTDGNGAYTFNWAAFPICNSFGFTAIDAACAPFQSLHYDFGSQCFWADPVACALPPITQTGTAAVLYQSDTPNGLTETGGVNAWEPRSTVSVTLANPHCYPLMVWANFCTPSVWSRFWHSAGISSTSWRYTARLDGAVVRRDRWHTHELRPPIDAQEVLHSQATGGETFSYMFQVPAGGSFTYEVEIEYALNDQYPANGGRESQIVVGDDTLQVFALAVKDC